MNICFGFSTEHLKKYFEPTHAILPMFCHEFSDGEQAFSFSESLDGQHVCLIHSTCLPTHQYFMELFVRVSTLQKHGALVHLIMPYAAYTRSIENGLFVRFINSLNLCSLVLLDLHLPKILNSIKAPTIHLSAMDLFCEDILKRFSKSSPVLVSPDYGGRGRVDYLCEVTGFSKAYICKKRVDNTVFSHFEQGNVAGKTCILVDDVIDSGQTLLKAAQVLLDQGALDVHAYATHGIFSTHPFSSAHWEVLNSITVTNSCPPDHNINSISIDFLLKKVISLL